MRLSNVSIIFTKELKDVLRDRRTLISMLVVPILLMPVIMVGFGFLVGRQVMKIRESVSQVALARGQGTELAAFLEEDPKITLGPPPANVDSALARKEVQGVVEIQGDVDPRATGGKPLKVLIKYDSTDERSEVAEDRLKRRVREYNDRIVAQRLTAAGLDTTLLTSVQVASQDLASREKRGGKILGTILPLMVVVMCFLGGMYPAIDLTAGEKERGTLETLLVSPATRLELVVGKYLVVLLSALVAACLNLASMGGTFYLGFATFSRTREVLAIAVEPQALLVMALLTLPLAGTLAAILLAISLLAKSYKEAQSYIGPLNLVVIFPAYTSLLPGVELTARTAWIPVVNFSLAFKSVLTGRYPWGELALIFASTLLLAMVAFAIAKVAFEQEGILFRQ